MRKPVRNQYHYIVLFCDSYFTFSALTKEITWKDNDSLHDKAPAKETTCGHGFCCRR